MDVHLRDLRYFTAVAEELHFRKAAERLFVSQPVLSRQIARLEQDLKARLFIRDRRSVQLTSAGEALLHRARHLLEDWDAATKEVTALARKEQSVLVIGLQTGVGRGMLHTLTQALNAIQWRPELHQVAWNDATAGVEAGDCDAGFAWLGTTINPRCDYVVVAEEPIMLAVTANTDWRGVVKRLLRRSATNPLWLCLKAPKNCDRFGWRSMRATARQRRLPARRQPPMKRWKTSLREPVRFSYPQETASFTRVKACTFLRYRTCCPRGLRSCGGQVTPAMSSALQPRHCSNAVMPNRYHRKYWTRYHPAA